MKVKMSTRDKLWAGLVKERDRYTCQRCQVIYPEGRRQGLHAHHIFGRSRRTTRWMLENGIALCFGDHMWAHSNPLEFHEWMQDRLGAGYEDLRSLSLKTKASA
jgi:hypothetical protein